MRDCTDRDWGVLLWVVSLMEAWRRIGQPPTPPASLRQTEPAGAPSGLGVRGVSAGEARSRALRSGSLCCRCLDCAPGLLRRARALPLPLPLPLSVLPLVLFAPFGCPSRTITGTTDRVLSRGYTRSTVPCAARMQRRACHADGSRD